MAGEDLFASLYSSRYSPLDTGWGIAAQGVSAALPGLVNPYGNPFSNFATVLGGALVSGLLGYQARQASDERNVLQSALLTEALKPDITVDRRKEILDLDPRLSRVLTNIDLSRAMADIEARRTQAQEEAKARVDVQKQIDIERGVPYGTTKASELITPAAGPGQSGFLGKAAEGELEKIQKTFSNRPEFKQYSYTRDVLKRLAQGVMKTDAVSDVDFAKGAIQAIEPGLATTSGEVNAITQSPSIPEQLKAAMANAADGTGKLTPKIRAQILGIVEGAYKTQADTYNNQFEFYKNEAISKIRRPEAAEQIEKRISDLGRPEPYEAVVNKWFKVPGYELGDLDADKVIKSLASNQLDPQTLINALEQRKRQPTTQERAIAATGPSTTPVVVQTPGPGATLAPLLTPSPTPTPGPQMQQLRAPTADQLSQADNKVTAAAELRALDRKGVANWTMDERVRALQLRAILKG